jgi:sugar lactone lactonase YvrE
MRFSLVLLALVGLLVPITAQAQVLFLQVKNTVGSGFNTPYGSAVDRNGNLFVADYNNQAIYEILASGGVVSSGSTVVQLAAPSGGYSQPVGVAVDSHGDVFVADAGTANAVDEIVAVNGIVNGSSTVIKLPGLPVFGYPNDLAVDVDGNGDLFVAYPDNQVVFEIVASGGVVSSASPIVALPAPSGGWAQPSGVTVDGSGNVFVADSGTSRLYEIPAAGGYKAVNLIASSTGGATTVAADRNGNIFYIGSFGTVLYEVPAAGGYANVNIVAIGFNGNYFGLAPDEHGNIFVADAASSVVDEIALGRVNFGSHAIGSPGETITLPFNISLSGPTTVGKIAILTTGAAGKDFADAGSSTCVATTYSSSQNCVVNVSFTPLAPGLRRGAVVFYDGSGHVLATIPISGVGTGPQVAFLPGTQSTLASGSFSSPSGVAVDANGNLFVADSGTSTVEEIAAAGGYTSVKVLGSGFSQPTGLAVDGSGNVFVADSGNHVVKEILAAGGYTGVNTLGGSFKEAAGMALDGGGNVLVADAGNNAVYEILAAGGYSTVNTLGTGFNYPTGVAVDGSGNVFVADSGNGAVREILATGDYTTINTLGSGFSAPVGVAVDGSGSVYVADANNGAVYEIPAAGGYTTVNTLGSGFSIPLGVALDGSGNVFVANRGSATVDKLDLADFPSMHFAATKVGATSSDSPKTVEVENIGNQALTFTGLSYPTDFPEGSSANACTHSTILGPAQDCSVPVDFTPLSAANLSEMVTLTDNALNQTGAQQSISASGTGQAVPTITWKAPAAITYGTALSATQLNATASVPGTFAYSPATGTVLAAGSQTLSVTFTPTNTTNYSTATAQVTLQVNKAATSISFSANPAKPMQGQSDLLTATVTGAGQPGGTVVFSSGTTTLCTATLNASGIGSCSFVPSTSGNLTVTAQYMGDANHLTSSTALTLVVSGTVVKLQLSSTQLVYPGATNLTACMTPTTATGTVQIYDGATLLSTQSVQGGGCAYWYISPGLSAGTHSLTAVYSGDKNNPPATSAPVTVTVSPVPVTMAVACWNASFAYGANYQCTVNLSSNAGAAQGSITYSLDGGSKVSVTLSNGNAQFTLTKPNARTHTVVVSYAQQTNYAAASSQTETFTVTPAPVIVSLTPSSWYAYPGTSLTFQAAISSSSAGAPSATGAVSFYDGAKLLSTVPVNASGQAAYATAGLSAGIHTITAVYAGGTNYASGSSSVVIILIL